MRRVRGCRLPRIEETPLPGDGLRLDFTADDGNRIGVVHHRTERKELFVCARSSLSRSRASLLQRPL